jgi:hypothetical protein
VRQGASWTAADHRQLTVAAVARPVGSSVGALGVLAAERSWLVLAQATSARSSLQPVSIGSGVVAVVDTASSHATASVAGVQQAVATHPGSASGIRPSGRPVSGHLGSSSSGSAGRPSAVHPSSAQPSAVHPSSVQPSGVCPVRPDTSVSSHLRRWRWGPGRAGRVTLTTGPVEAPVATGPSTARSTVEETGTRATLPKSGWSVGGRWRTRAAGLGAGRGGRACPLSDQAGQAGARSPLVGGCAVGARVQAAARGGCTRRVAGVLGLGGRPRWVVVAEPAARVGEPGGATGGAVGDRRAAPARPKPAASAPGSLPAVL